MFHQSVDQYLTGTEEAREIALPSLPAMYVWRFDFARLVGKDESIIRDGLARYMEHRGAPIGHYGRFVYWQETARRTAMKPERMDVVARKLSIGDQFAMQFASALTETQRPLYVGITRDLHRRTTEHLQSNSTLKIRLGKINAEDCLLSWVEVTEPTNRSVDDSDDGGESYDDGLAGSWLAACESMLIRTSSATANQSDDS